MKTKTQIIIFLLTFFALTLNAHTQTQAEQLNQMVLQLQTTPKDDALREKIIKLAAAMKPAPAIPEEARRLYIRGNTAFKDAASPDELATVITRYNEALQIAPWFADAYFNLAKAQEMHKDFDAAIRSLKFFLLTVPPQADARTAQDQIYALEEKRDKAATQAKTDAAEKAEADKAEAARVAAAEDRRKNSIEGYWFSDLFGSEPFFQIERVGERLICKPLWYPDSFSFTNVQITETSVSFTWNNLGGVRFVYYLSDGVLKGTHTGTVRTEPTIAVRKPWPAKKG